MQNLMPFGVAIFMQYIILIILINLDGFNNNKIIINSAVTLWHDSHTVNN